MKKQVVKRQAVIVLHYGEKFIFPKLSSDEIADILGFCSKGKKEIKRFYKKFKRQRMTIPELFTFFSKEDMREANHRSHSLLSCWGSLRSYVLDVVNYLLVREAFPLLDIGVDGFNIEVTSDLEFLKSYAHDRILAYPYYRRMDNPDYDKKSNDLMNEFIYQILYNLEHGLMEVKIYDLILFRDADGEEPMIEKTIINVPSKSRPNYLFLLMRHKFQE